jgi:hypothetical protein
LSERENLKEEKQLSLYEKKKKRDIALHWKTVLKLQLGEASLPIGDKC